MAGVASVARGGLVSAARKSGETASAPGTAKSYIETQHTTTTTTTGAARRTSPHASHTHTQISTTSAGLALAAAVAAGRVTPPPIAPAAAAIAVGTEEPLCAHAAEAINNRTQQSDPARTIQTPLPGTQSPSQLPRTEPAEEGWLDLARGHHA
jgi:hypothetical protein